MGVNPNSYRLAVVARFPSLHRDRGDIALRLDDDRNKHRVRLSVAEARQLCDALRDELARHDSGDQSPSSSGMPSSDGSPMDGKSV